MKRSRVALAALLTLPPAVLACSLLLDTSGDQCSSDGDCDRRGFVGTTCVNHVCAAGTQQEAGADASADAGGWGCLGNVRVPPPNSLTYKVQVPLVDLVAQKPVTAVTCRLCAKNDTACGAPILTTVPDEAGVLTFMLAYNFQGYVDILPNAPDAQADANPSDLIAPSLFFFNPPINADIVYGATVLVTEGSLNTIAILNGLTIDPTLGEFFMVAVDCNGQPQANVALALDKVVAGTQEFYFVSGVPETSATSTDPTGFAGFVNVPSGNRIVTASLTNDGNKYIGRAAIFTRPSTISYTPVAPSP